MKICSVVGLLLWGVLACRAQPTPEPITAFVHVNVLPMDRDTVLRDQTVLVRGTRIVAVGPAASVEIPEGARRIDGTGRYLMPGLAEMHGHVPGGNAPAQYVEDVMWLYVANGVTTVRGMLGDPAQLDLRTRINRGELVGPTLYLAGPPFSGNSVTSPAQAVEMVRRQKAEGWDLLKVLPGLSREVYDAMARTAHEVGIRFAGHVPEPSDSGMRWRWGRKRSITWTASLPTWTRSTNRSTKPACRRSSASHARRRPGWCRPWRSGRC